VLERVAKAIFAFGCAILIFGAGAFVGLRRLPPSNLIEFAAEGANDWLRHWRSYLGVEPAKFLFPSLHPGDGVVLHRGGEAAPGVTLMTGLWSGEVGLTLRAMDGKELHRWPTRFSSIWPQPRHLEKDELPFNDWDTHVHGALLYPEGDVVFNFEFQGMARLDRCGRPVWRLPRRTHHSVTADDQGDLWVPTRRELHARATARFPGLLPPFWEDGILEVSAADGRVLREISMLDVLYASGYEAVLFANGNSRAELSSEDPLHVNHVELLSSELARAFPMFAAGDILVSMRNLNLLVVLDGRTARVKWSRTGPWLRQHDPHFLPHGRLIVYDNHWLHKVGDRAEKPGSSRILAVDPANGRVDVLYEGTREHPFYSHMMGKVQPLANGNLLLVEATGGRVLETAPSGRLVWAFVNRYDAARVAVVEQATRYGSEYGGFAGQSCSSADLLPRR
jgi:hypothetical protein